MLRFARCASACLLGSLLWASSCMMFPEQRRDDSLVRTVREFNDGLRWGRDDSVLSCLSPTEAKGLQGRRALLGEEFVMADQELKSMDVASGSDKATVVAEFTWFDRRGVVKKSTVEQRWEWAADHWTVASWHRVAGERFPLVPEPLAGAHADASTGAQAPK